MIFDKFVPRLEKRAMQASECTMLNFSFYLTFNNIMG